MRTEINLQSYYLYREEIKTAFQSDEGTAQIIKDEIDSKANKNHSHDNAKENAPGFMSSADKHKLDTIDEGANVYVHPDNHSTTFISNNQTYSNLNNNVLSNQKLINDEINNKIGAVNDLLENQNFINDEINNKIRIANNSLENQSLINDEVNDEIETINDSLENQNLINNEVNNKIEAANTQINTLESSKSDKSHVHSTWTLLKNQGTAGDGRQMWLYVNKDIKMCTLYVRETINSFPANSTHAIYPDTQWVPNGYLPKLPTIGSGSYSSIIIVSVDGEIVLRNGSQAQSNIDVWAHATWIY